MLLLVAPVSMACEIETFKVFYIPLEVKFVVPPTREDILKRAGFEMASSKIACLFDLISKQVGRNANEWDHGGFRILIQDTKNGRELIISENKNVFFENKVYKVDREKLDGILNEIKEKRRE